MSKEFKRCPRCNFKTPSSMATCGNCGLNFNKFNNATNKEAKSAFRMGEKERVLYTKQVPSDVKKWKVLLMSIFGGWFGLHYFNLGRLWRGLLQIVGFVLAFVYTHFAVSQNIRTGYLGALILVCGFIWAASVIIWISDIFAIIFNRFKYPVSLPYSTKVEKSDDVKLHNDKNQ